jgi:hypothetical protein
MGRRSRHLNPKSLGATLALDARFIPGLSNGAEVASWPDRAGVESPAEGTSSLRPTYTSSWTGGQPAVSFNTTTTQKRLVFSTFYAVDQNYSCFAAMQGETGKSMFMLAGFASTGDQANVQAFRLDGSAFAGQLIVYSDPAGAGSARFINSVDSYGQSNVSIITQTGNGATTSDWTARRNGGQSSAWAYLDQTESTFTGLGYRSVGNVRINGTDAGGSDGFIGALSAFSGQGGMSRAKQKRMEHHYGYSFKIPCS